MIKADTSTYNQGQKYAFIRKETIFWRFIFSHTFKLTDKTARTALKNIRKYRTETNLAPVPLGRYTSTHLKVREYPPVGTAQRY